MNGACRSGGLVVPSAPIYMHAVPADSEAMGGSFAVLQKAHIVLCSLPWEHRQRTCRQDIARHDVSFLWDVHVHVAQAHWHGRCPRDWEVQM